LALAGGCWLLISSAAGNDAGNSQKACVRQRDVPLQDLSLSRQIGAAAGKGQFRPAAHVASHCDIAPADAASPTGAQRLEHSFLARKPHGIALWASHPAGLAVVALRISKTPLDKLLAVLRQHGCNPIDLHHIYAMADDAHRWMVTYGEEL
jgi:hypothetical protein